MKVLLICHKMPFPLHDGGAHSIYHTALGLIYQKADLTILAINTPKSWVDEKDIPADFKEKTRFSVSTVDTRFKLYKAFFNLFTARSYFVERFYSEQFNTRLTDILKNEKFDIIQLEHTYLCLYLKTIRKYSVAGVILRPQNVEHKVWQRILSNKLNPFKKLYLRIATIRLKKFEIAMAANVDGIIAISPEDTDSFSKFAPETPVIFVPAGFNFSPAVEYDYDKQYSTFPVFYSLGSMDWLPNILGIKWFIEEVIPEVIVEYPDFVFRIAGKRMPGWISGLQSPHLIIDGEIEDALKYHEDKSVMIVPLFAGGGIRIKIIEGMALGKTIISTTIGAEGIPYRDGENILISDTRETFVSQIKKCMNSVELCRKISSQARILAAENFNYTCNAEKMIHFYSRVIHDQMGLKTTKNKN